MVSEYMTEKTRYGQIVLKIRAYSRLFCLPRVYIVPSNSPLIVGVHAASMIDTDVSEYQRSGAVVVLLAGESQSTKNDD